MQTNCISNNQLHYTNDFNIFSYNLNNSYESDKDKENQENEVKEEKSLNSINQEDNYFSPEQASDLLEKDEKFKNVKNFYDKDNIDEEIQKMMKPSLIGKKRKRRTAYEIERDKSKSLLLGNISVE